MNQLAKLQAPLFEKGISDEEYDKRKQNFMKEYFTYRQKEEGRINKLTLNQRQRLHKPLLWVYAIKNRLDGLHYEIVKDEHMDTQRPKIFVVTHVGKYDIGVVSEAIKDHYYLLSGDFEHLQGTVEAAFLVLNGVFYVNQMDRDDRKAVTEKMTMHLKMGGNLMWFIEGAWNLTPNLPVLPCYWGIVDVARAGNAMIVPIAAEQYGKRFKVRIGKNFDMAEYDATIADKTRAITDLRDVLATLKWDIWESEPMCLRKHFDDAEWERTIIKRLNEWNLDMTWVNDRIFKPKGIYSPEEVFAPIRALKK